jgi:hypothetical protein
LNSRLLKKSLISSVAAAARVYDVPRSTLRANNHKLTQLDEDILTEWVLSMDDRGAAPRPPMVRVMANILLAATGADTVGKN